MSDERQYEGEAFRFRNFYECPECGELWSDDWPAQADDDCPGCGCRHISPYESVDIDEEGYPVGDEAERIDAEEQERIEAREAQRSCEE